MTHDAKLTAIITRQNKTVQRNENIDIHTRNGELPIECIAHFLESAHPKHLDSIICV